MWLKAEAWNEIAKEAVEIPKGTKIQVIGKLLVNKWIDKGTGEERKNNVFRITRFLDEQQIEAIDKSLAELHPPGMNVPTQSISNNHNQRRNNNYYDHKGGNDNRQQPQMNQQAEFDDIPF